MESKALERTFPRLLNQPDLFYALIFVLPNIWQPEFVFLNYVNATYDVGVNVLPTVAAANLIYMHICAAATASIVTWWNQFDLISHIFVTMSRSRFFFSAWKETKPVEFRFRFKGVTWLNLVLLNCVESLVILCPSRLCQWRKTIYSKLLSVTVNRDFSFFCRVICIRLQQFQPRANKPEPVRSLCARHGSALTVGRDPDDGEEDLVLRRVLVADAEGGVGDDDPGVLLHVDAADGHHRLAVLSALLREETPNKKEIKKSFNKATMHRFLQPGKHSALLK